MTINTWFSIPGYDNYQINRNGDVQTIDGVLIKAIRPKDIGDPEDDTYDVYYLDVGREFPSVTGKYELLKDVFGKTKYD